MSLACRSRFSEHDGLDVRVVLEWTSQMRHAMCAGCRRAAKAMGFDLRDVAA
jgi:hypothetical protein